MYPCTRNAKPVPTMCHHPTQHLPVASSFETAFSCALSFETTLSGASSFEMALSCRAGILTRLRRETRDVARRCRPVVKTWAESVRGELLPCRRRRSMAICAVCQRRNSTSPASSLACRPRVRARRALLPVPHALLRLLRTAALRMRRHRGAFRADRRRRCHCASGSMSKACATAASGLAAARSGTVGVQAATAMASAPSLTILQLRHSLAANNDVACATPVSGLGKYVQSARMLIVIAHPSPPWMAPPREALAPPSTSTSSAGVDRFPFHNDTVACHRLPRRHPLEAARPRYACRGRLTTLTHFLTSLPATHLCLCALRAVWCASYGAPE